MKKSDIFTLPERLEALFCGRKRILFELLYAGISGALAATVFEGISFTILAPFLLLPLFFFLEKCTWKEGIYRGFLWGYFWNLCGVFWLREIVWILPFLLAAVLGVFNGIFGGAFVFYRKYFLYPLPILLEEAEKRNSFIRFPFWKRFFFPIAPAAFFTLLEFLRSHVFTGFPWNLLGSVLWEYPILIQITEYTGIYGLSFLLVLFNLAFYETFLQFYLSPPGMRWQGFFRKISPSFLLLLPLTVLLLCQGEYAIKKKGGEGKEKNVNILRAGIVQPNLSQRRHGTEEMAQEALQVNISLSRQLLEECRKKGEMPHIVIWPETAVPYLYNSTSPGSTRFRQELSRLILEYDIPFLIGAIFLTPHPESPRELPPLVTNSALLLEKGKFPSFHHKVHLVPFGEYVPFGNEFPILNRLVGMGRNLTPGSHFKSLIADSAPQFRFGVAICYEDIFPFITSSHAANGANILLTITNDAWYPTSFEPRQHFANSIFRAVENNLPFLRVGNMDYSCYIAPDGRVSETLFRDEKGKKDPGIRKRGCGILKIPVRKDPSYANHMQKSSIFMLSVFLLFLFFFSGAFLNFYRKKKYLYRLVRGEHPAEEKK